MRCEVFYQNKFPDGRAKRLVNTLEKHFPKPVEDIRIVDVFIVEGLSGFSPSDAREIFSDHVAQDVLADDCAGGTDILPGWDFMVEIMYKPGVTDPVALTAKDALKNHFDQPLGPQVIVRTAQKYLFKAHSLSKDEEQMLLFFLHNPLIQAGSLISREEWEQGKRFPASYPHAILPDSVQVQTIAIADLSDEELLALSKYRLLALSISEMKALQSYFRKKEVITQRKKKGLSEEITDVELEMIAQTWSEHCKHKIFNARIDYSDNEKKESITSLFNTYIRHTTESIEDEKSFLVSVFHDNSGIIRFDEKTYICFKVETHNSPSALDPYGGAITGIVGVNRDIIGTGIGAKPIFNTNFLCFGFPDTKKQDIPQGILHPQQVMAGVHKGIIDGGNQSGIPTVAGGFLFDESYLGKPLVYCGTGGILPSEVLGRDTSKKEILPGDLAVMAGGRIGKDGIHGATFSSLALSEESPTSAVQIGDPVTQKKMTDFIIEARDRGLYRAITDNGAGGLSSSLGEMATLCNGVRIYLDECPLKYQGLSPWEILVSESQERMSLAVPASKIAEFFSLAMRRDVEVTVVGEFTDSGIIEVLNNGKHAGLISLEFLHSGLPRMELKAEWSPGRRSDRTALLKSDPEAVLISLLKNPNIASREELVRQYDHEVQAFSIVKPFVGEKEDGHSDGAVLKPCHDSYRGITITHGICPRYGDVDAYHMAACAVDEAFRSHIALGGNPDEAACLDNFCWPDPLESETNPDARHKLAQLVRACKGLHDVCTAYYLPLVSGKDSMKNDAVVGGRKISVRPTLLVSLIGIIPDVRKSLTADFKNPGDVVFILGNTNGELGGTCFERIYGAELGDCPRVNTDDAISLYHALYYANLEGLVSSCHDLSDGGLGVALCESAIGGRLGVCISLDEIPGTETAFMEDDRLLFCESPSRFIVTTPPNKASSFEKMMKNQPCAAIGSVEKNQVVGIKRKGEILVDMEIDAIISAWKTPIS